MFICIGCISTGGNRASIKDVNKSLLAINKGIHYAFSGDPLRKSTNRRVIYSKYHPPGGDLNVDATQSPKRAQAVVYILESRRPYTLVIDYRVQEDVGGTYKTVYTDRTEADKIKGKLWDYLASRPEKRDLIDGFRAF